MCWGTRDKTKYNGVLYFVCLSSHTHILIQLLNLHARTHTRTPFTHLCVDRLRDYLPGFVPEAGGLGPRDRSGRVRVPEERSDLIGDERLNTRSNITSRSNVRPAAGE